MLVSSEISPCPRFSKFPPFFLMLAKTCSTSDYQGGGGFSTPTDEFATESNRRCRTNRKWFDGTNSAVGTTNRDITCLLNADGVTASYKDSSGYYCVCIFIVALLN